MPSSSQRRFQLKGLSGGLKSDRNATRIGDDQTPRAVNVEFSDDSARSARGSLKLNNQVAPTPGILCRVDPAYSPLYVEANKSVPLRGYITHRYDPGYDIGGDFAAAGSFPSETFHNRRGRSFERQISFSLPPDFRMGERPARGEGAPTSGNAAIEAGCGYDELLDDCTIIMQKGGDRTAPMSWALGIVNAGNYAYNVGLGSAPARKSNYFLVFMWLDAPEWAGTGQDSMRYDLATGGASGSTGSYSTQALRAFIFDGRNDTVAYALEPGRSYSVSLSVTLDTAAVSAGAWNHNGRVDVRMQEHGGRYWTGSFVDSAGGGTTTNLSTWKGPTDSLRYLAKYGIRYSGRDAEHVGLGYRMAPWQAQGWIPFGMDSAAMEHKGFRVADCSLNSIDDLYGPGLYTLTCSHAAGANTYVTINGNRALTDSNANFSQSPLGTRGALWAGYGRASAGAPATNFNPDALRGYRLVFPRSSVTGFQGGVFNIQNYVEQGVGDYRLFLQDVGSTATTWSNQPFLIRAFRWNQQDIVVHEHRAWASSRDYADPRVQFSLRSTLRMDDSTEPQLSKLVAYWPYDDAGGRVCRELVRGKHGFMAPFGLALSKEGAEGENALFLSGEGDALVYDLSEHPVFARELRAMQQSNSRGFAVEVSCIIPEAHYGVATLTSPGPRSGEYEAAYCPDLVTVSVKDADNSGSVSPASPILCFGHHSWWQIASSTTPERRPQGFQLDVHRGRDSDSPTMQSAIVGFTRNSGGAGLWDDTTPWVGRRVTIQIGFQPSPANRAGTAGFQDEYRIYIAATPKGDFKYAAGDDPQAEFAYYADLSIHKKDLLRSVISIGGGWNPGAYRGYTEYGARLIVDKVRVYGATAAGELPTSSGSSVASRRGKILGRNSLPQRALALDDMLAPLGPGLRTLSVTEGSSTQAAPGNTSLFTQLPETTSESVREKFLAVLADTHEAADVAEVSKTYRDFYWIQSVASDGLSLSTATPYDGSSANGIGAAVFNVVGYVNFDTASDDVVRRPLTLGSGTPYKPGVTGTDDLVLSEPLFENLAPVEGVWRVRVASPFTDGGLARVLPKWTRGVAVPRANEITGVVALDDEQYATAGGAIFRVDDRWVEDGPTQSLRSSLAFAGREVGGLEARWPLVNDAARFANYSNVWPYWTSAIYDDFTWVYDFWVRIDEYAEIQTLLWLGCDFSHLQLGPAANDNRRGIGLWVRLNGGRPELVRESQANFSGGASTPQDGRYTSTAADRIPLRTWTHLRLYLTHNNDSGTLTVKKPVWKINGRTAASTVNGVETGLAGADDWIQPHNGGGLIGTAGDARNLMLLGAARDCVRIPSKAQFAALGQLGGREFLGGRIAGRMHPLLGRMADVAVWRAAASDASVSGFPDFDPYTLDYSGRLLRFRAKLQDGVGYKVTDEGTDTASGGSVGVGIVESHPFIDLFSELEADSPRPSFAQMQQRVYVANGGRVAYVERDRGGEAGVLPPSTKPSFVIERKPLWGENVALVDVQRRAAVGTEERVYHLSSHGNNYLTQAWHDEMKWTKDDSASPDTFDVLAVKFLWSPRDVMGRIPLWSSRRSRESGGLYLECVDGKVELGWYDTALKERVSLVSSTQVFRPGYWYYVALRKAFPMQDAQEGNWLNSYWADQRRRRATFGSIVGTWAVGNVVENAGQTKQGVVTKVTTTHIEYWLFTGDTDFTSGENVRVRGAVGNTGQITQTPYQMTGDALVVREFEKISTSPATNFNSMPTWPMKPSTRACISFTSEMPRSPNTTAIGQVTPKGVIYNGGATGEVTVSTALPATTGTDVRIFHPDMLGMIWQFSATSANAPEATYRIAVYISETQVRVFDQYGNAPNLVGFVDREGGVFSGAEMQKSERFDESNQPDISAYPTEFMGSELALDPSTGVARHSGKFDSFAWVVVSSNVDAFYSQVQAFQNSVAGLDHSEIGLDSFANEIITAAPGPVRADSARTFACVNTVPYAGGTHVSSQPNEALEVKLDAESSTNAESLYWQYLSKPDESWGTRKVAVVFYDADQDSLSNPGPLLTVDNPPEDKANPSGLTRLVLTGLPVSYQSGNIQRWVYVSMSGEPVPFRQAIVSDNISSSVGLDLDESKLDLTVPLYYDNAPPPDCRSIGVSQGVMFYGDVKLGGTREPSGLRFSKPFFPLSVPYRNYALLLGGKSDGIVGMADLNGRLIVWKHDSMFLVTIREGAAIIETISKNVGLAGPQAMAVIDQEVYWLSSDRGLYFYSGAGGPVWLGKDVSDSFAGSNVELPVDARELRRASLAVNRAQDQIVMCLQSSAEAVMRRRFSIEYDSALSGAALGDASGFRYASYKDPNVTALGSADRTSGGPQRLLAGTAEGFLAYLDREDTQLHLAGSSWNVSSVTLGAASTTSNLVLAAPVSGLTDLEGIRGAPLSWTSGGVTYEATALFSDGSSIYLDRPVASAPATGTVVSIGAIPWVWESKWLDMGNFEEKKEVHYLDLVLTPQAGGTATIEFFRDFEASPAAIVISGVLATSATIDLTRPTARFALGEIACQHLKFRIRSDSPGVKCEVVGAVLRPQDVELH